MTTVIKFFSEVRAELAKVSWPTPAQTINLTIVVIVVSLLVGVYIGVLDLGLASLSGKLLK